MGLLDILNLEDSYLEKEKILKYFKKRKKKGYIEESDSLKEYLIKNNYKEVEELLEDADRYLSGIFIFDRKWDMERCKTPYEFKEKIDWTIVPFKDPEWTYMLNRHKHLLIYAWSFYITKEDKYFYKLKEELTDWIDNVKVQDENMTLAWRTIEAGIRLRNFTKIFELIIDHKDFDYEFLEKYLNSIYVHIDYILRNSKESRILSNWVILENHGVFIASEYFEELKISKEGKEKSIKMIEKALNIQILSDGLQWEQSFMYHNEMVNCILDMIIIDKRNNNLLKENIKDKLKDMLYATLNIADPNLHQINYGDSDNEDLSDILSLGAIVLEDDNLKRVNKAPLETLLTFGYDGIKVFESLNTKSILKSKAFLDSGNYIIRDNVKEKDIFTFFKCGPLGSGHGHYDLLHFMINYKGFEILSDSGRFTYNEEDILRNKLKEAKSHNTILVDDLEFNISKGAWSSLKVSNYIKRDYKFGKLGSLVEGAHTGYKGVFTNRKLIYLNSGIWILSDEFFTDEKHKYSRIFNFNKPNCKIDKNKVIYNDLNSYEFNLIPLNGGEIRLEEGLISKEYNSIYKTQKVVIVFEGDSNTFLNTVMYVNEEEKVTNISYVEILDWKNKKLDEKYAKGIKIIKGETTYIVVIVTDEEPSGRKTYIVDGTVIYGRVTIIKRTKDNEEIEVLSY